MVSIYVGVYSYISESWIQGATVWISGPGYSAPEAFQTVWNADFGSYVAGPMPTNSNSTYHLVAEASGHGTEEKDFITSTVDVRTDLYLSVAGVGIRAESISVTPNAINMGDTFDITVTYKNYGNSGTQQKNIYSDTTLIKINHVSLDSGATVPETYNMISGACPQLCVGTHTIRCDNKITTLYIESEFASILISPESASIGIGSTRQLAATCKDIYDITMECPTLTWVSNDDSIATIDSSGKVTGITKGTVIITTSSGSIVSNVSTVAVTEAVEADTGIILVLGILGLGFLYMITRRNNNVNNNGNIKVI